MRFFLDKDEIDLILTYLREENQFSDPTFTQGYLRANGPIQKARAAKLVQKILKTVEFETRK